MRGDRPAVTAEAMLAQRATPHARGSTPCPLLLQRLPVGYPACAGIDPRALAVSAVDRGLPRMRGDRPGVVPSMSHAPPATPHARGSTRNHHRRQPGRRGYPACAGIDLSQPRNSCSSAGLPRMRGDRPAFQGWSPLFPVATPHARGSTLQHFRTVSAHVGYPACAGIDPPQPWPV